MTAGITGPSTLTAKASDGVLNLTLYGEIQPDVNESHLSATSARAFKEALESSPDATAINLYINSRGGSVEEGNVIYTLLKRSTATVTVYIDGWAASMASAIAMAGDKVIMSPQSTMMIHNPSGMAYGNAADMRKAADDLEVLSQAFKQTYLLKAGPKLDEATLDKLMEDETFLTAKQALEYGLCDEIAFTEDASSKLEIAALKAEVSRLSGIVATLTDALTTEPITTTQPKENKGWFFHD